MAIRMNFYNDGDGGPMLARVGTWYLQIPNRLIFEDGVISKHKMFISLAGSVLNQCLSGAENQTVGE